MGHFFKHLVEALTAVIFVTGMAFEWCVSHLYRRIRRGSWR